MKRKSIFRKILLSNFKIMLLPFLLIMVFIVYLSCEKIKREEMHDMRLAVTQYAQGVDARISTVVSLSENIQKYPYIISNLDRDFENYFEVYDFVMNSNQYLDSVISGPQFADITIYSENPKLFTSKYFAEADALNNYRALKERFRAEALDFIWDEEFCTDEKGNHFFRFFKRLPLNTGCILSAKIYIQDAPENIQILRKNTNLKNSISANINDYYDVVGVVDTHKLHLEYIKIAFLWGSFSLLLAIVLYYVTYKTIGKTTFAIRNFIMRLEVNSILDSDWEINISEDESDEEWVIKETISMLLNEIKRITTLQHRLEFDLLQSQIDPHTLYNSLSAIKLDAAMHKNDKLANLIDNMTAYYRTVLNRGKTEVALSDEMEMIQKYITINELSHYKKYNLQMEIPDELKDTQIPHLLLQPFVENAVIHGLAGSQNDCVLKIRCFKEGEFLVITISDNGRGMNKSLLKQLNNPEAGSDGYGTWNAYMRLKLKYGQGGFAIHFDSEKEQGTTVTIKFLCSAQGADSVSK